MAVDFQKGIRLILIITVPAAAGLALLSGPIVRLIYMHGNVTPTAASQMALLLSIMVIGLPFFSVVNLTVRAFYAIKDTKTPVRVAMVDFLINITASLALIHWFGVVGHRAREHDGHHRADLPPRPRARAAAARDAFRAARPDPRQSAGGDRRDGGRRLGRPAAFCRAAAPRARSPSSPWSRLASAPTAWSSGSCGSRGAGARGHVRAASAPRALFQGGALTNPPTLARSVSMPSAIAEA